MPLVVDANDNYYYLRLWQAERAARQIGMITADQWDILVLALNRERSFRERQILMAMDLHTEPHPVHVIPPVVRAAIDALAETEAFMAVLGVPVLRETGLFVFPEKALA